MADTMQGAMTTVQKIRQVDVALEEIFKHNFALYEEHNINNVGYQAYGLMAVSVAIAVANVFLAIKHPQDHRTYRAVCDMTFGLATNKFWTNNSALLVPVMQAALNAYRDGADMLSTRKDYSQEDALIACSRALPLEVFAMIAYCLGDQPLMAAASLQLKRDLSPYFLS